MTTYTRNTLSGSLAPVNNELEKIEVSLREKLDRNPSVAQNNEMLDDLDMNSNRIINYPDAVNDSDLITKGQVASLAPVQSVDGQTGNVLSKVQSVNGQTGNVSIPTQIQIDNGVVFDNIAEMKSSSLEIGQLVKCKRYYALGDLVEGLEFECVAGGTGTDDGGSFHDLANGNQAQLISSGTLNVRQFGAVGDGTTDDTIAFENIAVVSNSIYISVTENSYKLSRAITLEDGTEIFGSGYKSFVTQATLDTDCFILGDDCSVTNMRIKTADSNDSGFPSAVYANRVNNPRISNNFIQVGANGACGIHSRNCRQSIFTENVIYGGSWDGLGSAQAPSACDIMFYSANAEPSERHIISGNFCLSNNSQGIGVDLLGYDSDVIVANNICVTLDPATCVDGGAWDLIAEVNLIRRHGIMLAYNDSLSSGTRAIIEGNICRNTGWTGIRKLGNNSEPVVITNNFCSFNGLSSTTALAAGIYIGDQSGVEIVANNYITNFLNAEIEAGAVVVTKSTNTANANFTSVTGNSIKDCSQGVILGLVAHKVSVKNNAISTSGRCVVYNGSPNTESGGHIIESNEMQVTSINSAISVRAQTSAYDTIVTKNVITGFDNTTNDTNNAGVRLSDASPRLIITDNYIINCYHGVYGAAFFIGGRMFDYIIQGNIFKDCERGFSVGSSSSANVLPLVDNIFNGVTTEVGNALAGFGVGVACQKIGNNIEFYRTSIPTTGAFIAGDRAYNPASIVGQPKAWRYDSTGAWVSEGVL